MGKKSSNNKTNLVRITKCKRFYRCLVLACCCGDDSLFSLAESDSEFEENLSNNTEKAPVEDPSTDESVDIPKTRKTMKKVQLSSILVQKDKKVSGRGSGDHVDAKKQGPEPAPGRSNSDIPMLERRPGSEEVATTSAEAVSKPVKPKKTTKAQVHIAEPAVLLSVPGPAGPSEVPIRHRSGMFIQQNIELLTEILRWIQVTCVLLFVVFMILLVIGSMYLIFGRKRIE